MPIHHLITWQETIDVYIEEPDYQFSYEILYPEIYTHPGVKHTIVFSIAKTSGGNAVVTSQGILTDGNYVFTITIPNLSALEDWHSVELKINIPDDWIVEETGLTFTCQSEEEEDSVITIKDLDFFAFWGGIQYLPIMGIG